jgi:hypothetical protein
VLLSVLGSQMGNWFAAKSNPVLVNGVLRGRGRVPGALSHMVAANLRARALASVVREIWAEGFMSYNAMSRELNRRNVPTLRGGRQWYPMTAGRLLVRLERAGLIRIRRPSARGSLLQLASRK